MGHKGVVVCDLSHFKELFVWLALAFENLVLGGFKDF